MRLRNIPGSEEIIKASEYAVKDPKEKRGNWKQEFKNSNDIQIEIGMGKGKFIVAMAKQNPGINFIGIEKYASVLLRAIQKVEMEEAKIPNLLFICMDAEELEEVFDNGEIAEIYLNFSDPWPKDRHARRRLPSKEFLARYDRILEKEGRLEFKTDNRLLFDFGVEQLELTEWKTEKITYDLHHEETMNKGNIMTEYEEKFSSQGNPIYKYIIYR